MFKLQIFDKEKKNTETVVLFILHNKKSIFGAVIKKKGKKIVKQM